MHPIDMTRDSLLAATAIACLPLVTACGSSDTDPGSRWAGTIDTLASGQITVHNPDTPIWTPEAAWRVEEELRIGTMEGDGPDLFGQVRHLEPDAFGRIWVLEGQAQEIRVFGPDGSFVRTVGREGGGPGEFARALQVQTGPDGNMWVMDPANNRMSVFDTAGTYLEGKQVPGGFVIMPWPGGFDMQGSYYSPVPLPSEGDDFHMGLAVYDTSFVPYDTVEVPTDPVDREYYELRSENSLWRTGIPYTGRFDWRLASTGRTWGMLSDEYRFFELNPTGDTVRTIVREYTPLPVTDADMEQARERLESFIRNGGKVDWSKIPSSKPAMEDFYLDDGGNVWVRRVTDQEQQGREFDIFDPVGRFLGTIRTSFSIARFPPPVFDGDVMYAVTEDELEVPYIVRARIVKPERP